MLEVIKGRTVGQAHGGGVLKGGNCLFRSQPFPPHALGLAHSLRNFNPKHGSGRREGQHRRACPGWPGAWLRSGFGGFAQPPIQLHQQHDACCDVGKNESAPEDIAERVFAAVADDRRLLLPDRTSRLAWWINRLAPAVYARAMKRRVGAEFESAPR
ncbi:MAG: hypothetical protein NT123_25800 [Proteobacteria bacterium]|nr:hypothetical protein [Pseudomonadota bacterium]